MPGLEIVGETLEERFSALQSASRDNFVYELVSTRLNLDGRELALTLGEGADEELKSVFQEAWGEKIKGSLARFDRLLTRYEIGCHSQVMSILKPQIDARVQEYLDSVLGGAE